MLTFFFSCFLIGTFLCGKLSKQKCVAILVGSNVMYYCHLEMEEWQGSPTSDDVMIWFLAVLKKKINLNFCHEMMI